MKYILVLLLFFYSIAYADDLQLFGYYTHSAVKSNGVNIGGSTGNWSLDKYDLTLFGDYKINPSTYARFAVGSIDEPLMRDRNFTVKYALIDHQFYTDSKNSLGFRVGRIPHTFGFHTQTRNAPATGQFVYIPEGLPEYFEAYRWINQSGDGGSLYWNYQYSAVCDLTVSGSYTKANMIQSSQVIDAQFGTPKFGKFVKDDSYVKGFAVDFRYKNKIFYYHWIDLDFYVQPNFPYNRVLPDGRVNTIVGVYGTKWYYDKFDIGAEFMDVKLPGPIWDKQLPPYGDPYGWALTGTYHITEQLDVSAYHTEFYIQDGDKDGTKQSAVKAARGINIPPFWYYSKSDSISAKYKFNDKWTIKSQYTVGEGIAAFSKSTNMNSNKNWSYIAFQLVYSF